LKKLTVVEYEYYTSLLDNQKLFIVELFYRGSTREDKELKTILNKMKLKALLPSLREKKRYVGFVVESKESLDLKQVKESIETSMKELVGSLGMANAGLLFLKDWKDNKGIVRVSTKNVDHLKASLALIKEINGKKIIIKSLGVSGVVDKVRKLCYMEG
jgi:ribonuclease P/MRP protein subunit POP5